MDEEPKSDEPSQTSEAAGPSQLKKKNGRKEESSNTDKVRSAKRPKAARNNAKGYWNTKVSSGMKTEVKEEPQDVAEVSEISLSE